MSSVLHPREQAADTLPDQSLSMKRQAWQLIAAGATVPIGLAVAAAVTSYVSESEKVATTAWIVTAVVGAAGIIASAAAARRIFEPKSPLVEEVPTAHSESSH